MLWPVSHRRQNSPQIRAAIANKFAWLGVSVDPAANAENKLLISCLRRSDRRRADDRPPHAVAAVAVVATGYGPGFVVERKASLRHLVKVEVIHSDDARVAASALA
jgi:hypothetical protein